MVFIRAQGCDIIPHCLYCDTPESQNGNKGRDMDRLSIVDEVGKLSGYQRYSWVCITGGEPLWQLDELEELVRLLKAESYKVTIETNGSLPIPEWYGLVDSWSADIKCPSSGVAGVSKEDWFKTRQCDQVKFVISDTDDLEFASKVIKRHWADPPTVLVSPASLFLIDKTQSKIEEFWTKEWLQEVAEFCKREKVRFSLQIQKVIWGNKRGV